MIGVTKINNSLWTICRNVLLALFLQLMLHSDNVDLDSDGSKQLKIANLSRLVVCLQQNKKILISNKKLISFWAKQYDNSLKDIEEI